MICWWRSHPGARLLSILSVRHATIAAVRVCSNDLTTSGFWSVFSPEDISRLNSYRSPRSRVRCSTAGFPQREPDGSPISGLGSLDRSLEITRRQRNCCPIGRPETALKMTSYSDRMKQRHRHQSSVPDWMIGTECQSARNSIVRLESSISIRKVRARLSLPLCSHTRPKVMVVSEASNTPDLETTRSPTRAKRIPRS